MSKAARVSLLVRLWVEICCLSSLSPCMVRQPPREAVSWNGNALNISAEIIASASSWGCELTYINPHWCRNRLPSASSWGCELKYMVVEQLLPWGYVSLLVRLWVEMCIMPSEVHGSERQPPREAVSWNTQGSTRWERTASSASSWGCELKCQQNRVWTSQTSVSLLVRLWVEIHKLHQAALRRSRQPPREAVSWNAMHHASVARTHRQPPREAVSWNFMFHIPFPLFLRQPPREAVSWNARGSESPFEVRLLVRLPIQQDITRILPPL